MMNLEQKIDSDLLENLFKSHYKELKVYAFKYVREMSVAEDIVQEVFFDLWSKRNQIKININAKVYLFRAVLNRSINYCKAQKGKYSEPLEEKHEYQIQEYYFDTIINEEDILSQKEALISEIKNCIENLPPRCKLVFKLKQTYKLKNKEISEQLEITEKAVEKNISRAFRQIRDHLKGKDIFSFTLIFLLETFKNNIY